MGNWKNRTFLALLLLTLLVSPGLAEAFHGSLGLTENMLWGVIIGMSFMAWAVLHVWMMVQNHREREKRRLEAGFRPEVPTIMTRRRSERRQRKRNERITWRNRGFDGA